MENNLPTYVLTGEKLDATVIIGLQASEIMILPPTISLGKVNEDADALTHIPWEDHDQYIETDMVQVIIPSVIKGSTFVEVFSCNIQVTETLDMQEDSITMLLKEWITTQS